MSINLSKGQKISLNKEAGSSLSKVVMGLGWDGVQSRGLFGFGGGRAEIDLDASCVMFDAERNPIDTIWFRQLQSRDGSIRHSGDNRTGEGDGDDEQISVDLGRVPGNVQSLVFTVNSFTGQNFSQVENASCRLLDGASQREIARYNLSALGDHTAQIMVKLYRHEGEWKLHAIGEPGYGSTFRELTPHISQHL
ncbi:TerD family protein [Massilia sp. W12]|uniref:TerD family protein n=1 Tax=Massilia sp. W12 TaxID=3126507 RepID=UPI0030CE4CD3